MSDMPFRRDSSVQEALAASNDLVRAICGSTYGLSPLACRVLLTLWKSDGLSADDLAERLGTGRARAEEWLDALERADLVRRAREGGAAWLTAQGRAIPAGLAAGARGECFRALQADIVTLRDLLRRALHAAERETRRMAA